jgi:pre-rRNA-processing protein TSR2
MSSEPTIPIFARGLLALLDLWPALTIAVREEWGGPESADKKIWLASTLIDEFESRASYLPSTDSSSSNTPTPSPFADPATANDPPLEHDDLADLINQIMSDEFESNIEDGSIDAVAADIVRLWRDILQPAPGASASTVVEALERKAAEVKGKGIQATKGAGLQNADGEEDSDSEWDDESDEDGMDVDEAPQLVPAERERVEPVVDDDGFTLVQPKTTKKR